MDSWVVSTLNSTLGLYPEVTVNRGAQVDLSLLICVTSTWCHGCPVLPCVGGLALVSFPGYLWYLGSARHIRGSHFMLGEQVECALDIRGALEGPWQPLQL